MCGLPVDGLKADLQQRLRETLDNTDAAATHTTNTAKERTMNTNDNIETANNAALLTEASTHAKKPWTRRKLMKLLTMQRIMVMIVVKTAMAPLALHHQKKIVFFKRH